MSEYRTEEDTLGPVKIPAEALWGPQTERSRNNFPTGQYMPLAIIRALLNIKKAAAQANMETKAISEEKGNLIVKAIDELLALSDEELRKDFPLKVYQTGSGTQTNMNTNEVVAHKAHEINPDIEILPNDDVNKGQSSNDTKVYQTGSGTQTNMNTNEVVAHKAHEINPDIEILPNDDVNKGQSSNDTFPTAMNVVALEALDKLKPAVQHLIDELKVKEEKYMKTVKVGRTHLQDAVPLTFGQELSGYIASLEHDLDYIKTLESTLDELAIGGTAVGTGLNAAEGMPEKIAEKLSEVYGLNLTADSNKFYGLANHSGFGGTAVGTGLNAAEGMPEKIAEKLSEVYGLNLTADSNKFYGLANHSGLDVVHGALKTLAADMFKLAQDIRFLASGPRAGYGELNIPSNEPGSSIMPGKVNPTQAEAVTMAALRVFGNDTVVTMASSQVRLTQLKQKL